MIALVAALALAVQDQAPNTWQKRSPLEGGTPSPRLGYEGDCVWYASEQVLLRYGGHNQGGGGEQHAEVWTFDPATGKWTLKEPNTSPPGVCCAQQNLYDPVRAVYLRFPSFSGSHGWQWFREIYLNDSSVWAYDLARNLWRNRRPLPAPKLSPLRCASWDSGRQVAVVFGGEGSREGTLVYDPHLNAWTRMKPPSEPAFRSGGNMAYDAGRKLHVLFGAQFTDDPHTWAYDLARNEWRDLKPGLQPPTDRNDAVLAYDALHEVVVAVVKVTEGKDEGARHRLETWAFDAAGNAWKKMNPPLEPDASGSRARVLAYCPERGVSYLENRTHRPGPAEQQVWTYRYGDRAPGPPVRPKQARREPPAVEDLVVSVVSAREVALSWKAPGPGLAGYQVERAAVEVYSEGQLKRLKTGTAPLEEPSAGAVRRVGAFARVTRAPVAEAAWVDTSVDLKKPAAAEGEAAYERVFAPDQLDAGGKPYRYAVYAYRVRALGADGLEGGPSPAVFTLPSAPQWVFSKEDGTACRLKWAANPEAGIAGYRVYRMNGRYDKDGVARLTPEPVAETAFRDPEAGKKGRRYYVVAVDALGQEGHPSAPVWHEREWRSYYKPFTSEWHQ